MQKTELKVHMKADLDLRPSIIYSFKSYPSIIESVEGEGLYVSSVVVETLIKYR